MKKLLAYSSCLLSFMTTPYANTAFIPHKTLIHASLSNHSLDLSKSLKGNYMFALRDPQTGRLVYTQNAQMNFLKNGSIGQNNMPLQAYTFPTEILESSCNLVDLVLPPTLAPQATHEINLSLNLDSKNPVIHDTFNMNDTRSYSYMVNSEIYDSLGNKHDAGIYFIKIVNNVWSVYVSIDDQLITRGQVYFNPNGTLNNTEGLTTINYYPKNGAEPIQAITITFNNLTQFATNSYVQASDQDGSTTGYLTSFTIDNIGDINLTYSNHITIPFAKIAVFPNTLTKT